jgi:hypothetical protein
MNTTIEKTHPGEILKLKMANALGHTIQGCERAFANATGLSYVSIRQWVSKPIIPFLLAEFVAAWIGVSLAELMSWGVQVTLQARKNFQYTIIVAPNSEVIKDSHFLLIAGLLGAKDYAMVYRSESDEMLPVPPLPKVAKPKAMSRLHNIQKEKTRMLMGGGCQAAKKEGFIRY